MRPATPSDLAWLVQASIALGEETEGLSPDPDAVRQGIAAALRDADKARYWVAESDAGAVVGSLFVTYEWSDWTGGWYWWMQGLYVAPGARGQGVFRALYGAVVAAAQAAGDVRRIRLYVHESNAAAMGAYEALGMHRHPAHIYDVAVPG